jgi:putative transcriptional regulator
VLLVARADMQDPRFKEAVILATQAPDGHTVGVVLNRPLQAPLSRFLRDPRASGHRGRVGYGGPVMQGSVVALFRSAETPSAPAFHVLRGVYLSMHPKAVEPLLDAPEGRVRFFSGFSGWSPGQLRGEIAARAWHMLPATEEIAFRADTTRLWSELIEKARGFRTRSDAERHAILAP